MKKNDIKILNRFFLKIAVLLFFFVLSYNLNAQLTNPMPSTEYFIKNVYSGKYLENSDANWAVHRTFNEARLDRQKFTFELVNGRYKIKNVHTGFYAYRSGSNGWDINFKESTTDSWLIEASGGKTIIKWDSNNHWGVDTSGEGVYWSKVWATSPITRLQWEIVLTTDLDKTFLETAIEDAITIKNNAIIGTTQGYSQSDYDIFAIAITEAQQKLNSSTTQVELNNALVALREAITTFQSKYIKFIPVAGKYYTIKYGYDLALASDMNGKAKVFTMNAEDSLQRLRFELFDAVNDRYRIFNMKDQALDQVYDNEWDLIWEKINPGSQYTGYLFTIESTDQIYIMIKSVKTGKYLGVDSALDGSGVWSNKSSNNLWRISEAPEIQTSTNFINFKDFEIVISNKTLNVNSTTPKKVSVFNLNGVLIHESYSNTESLKLQNGLYIVKINSTVHKIVIQ